MLAVAAVEVVLVQVPADQHMVLVVLVVEDMEETMNHFLLHLHIYMAMVKLELLILAAVVVVQHTLLIMVALADLVF